MSGQPQQVPVLAAQNLSFAYRNEPVLRDVCFSVSAGDFVSVIGSNGAGKSTLLKLLLGELSPDSGEILLLGTEISRFRDWPAIGYVPQGGTALADGFPATTLEVVSMGLYKKIGPLRPLGKRHRALAKDALALVGMEDYAGRLIGKLSGGQIQRVLIARALVSDSRVLVLDEPTTGVDAPSALALYELLRTINRERGLTVIMVTHDFARAAPYVTRTLCLEHGTMVELDEAQLSLEMEHRHKH